MADPADVAAAPPDRRDRRRVPRDRRTVPGDQRGSAAERAGLPRPIASRASRSTSSSLLRRRASASRSPASAARRRARRAWVVLRHPGRERPATARPGERVAAARQAHRHRLQHRRHGPDARDAQRHAAGWRTGTRFTISGIGYSGDVVRDRGLTIYPTNPKGGDVFAAFQAKRLIDDIQPDVDLHPARHLDLRVLPAPSRPVSGSPEDRRLHPPRRQDRERAERRAARTGGPRGRLHALRARAVRRRVPAAACKQDAAAHVSGGRRHSARHRSGSLLPLPRADAGRRSPRRPRTPRSAACSAICPTPASRSWSSTPAGPTSGSASISR